MKNDIIVSVCMITYNQDSYIKQAIDGVLMQKCDFPFNLIIGEDFSTDNTRRICEEYAMMDPRIELLNSKSNLGVMPNFVRTLEACSGKYIALCEGDDYWTDPYKLQKQVDFLERNENFSFCFHNAKTHFIDTNIIKDFNKDLESGIYTNKDLLLKGWFIPTASLLFKRKFLPNPFPEWFYKVYSGDYALELLLSLEEDFYYINETTSVYRKNSINSLSSKGTNGFKILKKHLYLLENFKAENNKIKNWVIYYSMYKTIFTFLKLNIIEKLPFTVKLKNRITEFGIFRFLYKQ